MFESCCEPPHPDPLPRSGAYRGRFFAMRLQEMCADSFEVMSLQGAVAPWTPFLGGVGTTAPASCSIPSVEMMGQVQS